MRPCEICGSRRGDGEDSSLLQCYAVSTGKQLPRFHDIVHIHGEAVTHLRLPDPEDAGTIILRNAGNFFYQSIRRNVSKHLNLPSLRLLED